MPLRRKHHKLLSLPFVEHLPRGTKFGSDFDAAVAQSTDAWAGVRRQIRQARPEVVLISSEFLLMAAHVERIASFAEQYLGRGSELEFIAYLRTPSEFYVSMMQQWFKASAQLLALEPPDMLKQLDRYSSLGKVMVRKYDRAGFKDGSVISDICDLVGVDSTALDHKDLQANISLSAEGIILLQDYRRRYHAGREAIFTADTKAFIGKIAQEESAHPGLYTKPRLRTEIARALDRETPDLRGLRRRYGVALADRRALPWTRGAPVDRLGPFSEAAAVIEHDPALVEKLRRAVS